MLTFKPEQAEKCEKMESLKEKLEDEEDLNANLKDDERGGAGVQSPLLLSATAEMKEFGWWQVRAILLVSLVKVPSAWQMASILFTAPNLEGPFWCSASNTSFHDDPCARPCDTFHFSQQSVTFVTQWNLVCGRAILVPVSQFCYLFGILVGGVICTILLKWLSPRRILLGAMVVQVISGVGVALAPQFELQCFLRFVTATACANMFSSGFVICTDICSGRARTIVASCYEHMWSVGVMTLAALGYALDDWKQLQHAISIPTLLILTAYNWIPDSPKWLMAKGKLDEARYIMEEAAAFNGTKVAISEVMPPQSTGDREVTWCESLKQTRCLAMHIVWAATVVTYYGALLNVKSLGPHLHLNTIVAGAAEVLGVLLGLFLILWYDRKKWKLLAVNLLVGGGACMASWALPTPVNESPSEWALLGLGMVGRVAIAISLTLLQVKSGEILPPVSIFSCVTFARVFLLSAPFIGYQAMYGEAVSLSIFGGIMVLGGLATFFVTKPKAETQKQLNIVWSIQSSQGSYKESGELHGTEVPNGVSSNK